MRTCLHAFLVLMVFPLCASAVKSSVQYVDDIDQWQTEVWVGAVNPGGPLEGPALEAGTGHGGGLCFLPSGDAYFPSSGVIFLITKDKIVRIFAGRIGSPGYQDGPVTQALLGGQISICSDGKGGLYIGDRSNRCIRRLTRKNDIWTVETLAGDPEKPEWKAKPTDGTAREAVFRYIHSNIIADDKGTAYVMDKDFLRKISPDGKVETLTPDGGTGKPEESPLASARFSLIMGGGMCFGPDGCIYVADRWNHCIRKVDLEAKKVSIVVGPGGGYVDGPEKQCGFHDSPGHIVYDPYRKRFNTNGVDDWGVRVWEKGFMKTIVGGTRRSKIFEGPARDTPIHWGGTAGVDPRPPHDIYFWSGKQWSGRIGRLFRTEGSAKKGENK